MVEAMGDLRQRSYGNSEDSQTLARLALFLYEKTFRNEITFLGLQKACEQLSLHGGDAAWEGPLFELLVVLTPQLALASSSVARYGEQSEKLFSSLATQLLRLATEAGEDVKTAAVVALAALCNSPVMTEMLQRTQVLSALLGKLLLRDPRESGEENPDGVVARAALLANVCRGVQVSYEGCDASEECITVMNALANGILEETCEEVLQLRICGVYLLVKRGGITERLMAEAQGVGGDNHLAIGTCTDKWNQFVTFRVRFELSFLSDLTLRGFIDRNPGVEERIRRDEEEIKGNTMKEKLRKLEEKAERFHAMQRGLYEMGW